MNRSLKERERISMGDDSILNTSMQTEIRHYFKLILLGNVSVGKTSILQQFIDEKFDEKYSCTISADFRVKSMLIDHNTWVEMNIWDTCGQERYKTVTRQYFKDAQGCLLAFDLTNRKSFTDLETWIEDLQENCDDDITIVIVGNKADLFSREITFQEGSELAKKFKFDYIEVSAKSGTNINILFEILSKSMIKKCEFNEFRYGKRKGDRSYYLDKSKTVYIDNKDDDKKCC